jgi:adenylate cyclase
MQSGDSSNEFFEFKSNIARRAFDSLVDCFIEDYMVKNYVAEKAGWRTIAEVAQRAHLSPSALYGKHSTIGPVLDEPIRRGLIESRIFPGERGRGGEVLRLRIVYDKEPIKEFVNRKVRLGQSAITRTEQQQHASVAAVSKEENRELYNHDAEDEETEQRKLVAIMFTDIVGFTALAQADEVQSLQVLERHNRLLKPLFPKYRGREVKAIGDSFLVEFDSALDALKCGIEIQKVLHDYNISTQEHWRIKLRIGIHLGDIVRRGNDIFGDTVNIASRIEPLADPEGICVSQQVFDQVHNKIEYSLERLEHQELKNVKFQTDVYHVLMPWQGKTKSTKKIEGEIAEEEGGGNRRRIAVLPFSNLSPDPSDEYFADGMTEEVISTMSKIGGLKVIARTSVMGYKKQQEKRIDQIAEELRAGTILEGSVRKADSKLRITVQLIDSNTSEHLWSESYDRELKDVFAVQSDIAKTVADALKIKLLPDEKALIERAPTENIEAHTMFLKGMYYDTNASSEDDLRKALAYFERAIELDPSFAHAYSWASDCYTTLAQAGHLSPDEALPKAEKNVRKALELDPNLADAHRALGFLLAVKKKPDWIEAEHEIRKALEINQNVEGGHELYSWFLRVTGRLDEALVEAQKSLDLNPLSILANHAMADTLYYKREFDRAIEQYNRARELDPGNRGTSHGLGLCYLEKSEYDKAISEFEKTLEPSKGRGDLARAYLALAYSRSGRTEEARNILNDLKEISSSSKKKKKNGRFVPAFMIAWIHSALGEKEEAIEILEEAWEKGDYTSLQDLKVSPVWDPIRLDATFISLLKKVGLSEH